MGRPQLFWSCSRTESPAGATVKVLFQATLLVRNIQAFSSLREEFQLLFISFCRSESLFIERAIRVVYPELLVSDRAEDLDRIAELPPMMLSAKGRNTFKLGPTPICLLTWLRHIEEERAYNIALLYFQMQRRTSVCRVGSKLQLYGA